VISNRGQAQQNKDLLLETTLAICVPYNFSLKSKAEKATPADNYKPGLGIITQLERQRDQDEARNTKLMRATPKSEHVRHYIAHIFVVAAILNYVWELAQSSLYVGMNSLAVIWRHCRTW